MKQPYCKHCRDKETNYNCPCWFEGWLMGEAEYEFNHPNTNYPNSKMKVRINTNSNASNSVQKNLLLNN